MISEISGFFKKRAQKYKKLIVLYKKTLFFHHFLMSCGLIWSVFKLIVCKEYHHFISLPYLIMNIICLSFVILNVFNSIKTKNLEKIFVLVAIPLGLSYCFLQPPNFKPDEPHHLYRSYDIVSGNFMPQKDENNLSKIKIPIDIIKIDGMTIKNLYQVDEVLNKKINYNETVLVSSTAASQNPTSYVFSSLGILIGKTFNISWFWTYYLARMLNMIFYLILGYFSIKIIPFGKLVIFALLLNPMVIHQATAISGDAILNSVSIYIVCYIINIKQSKRMVTIKDFLLLLLLTLIVSLIKIPYFPLIFLLFSLPLKDFFKEKKNLLITILALIIFSAFIYFQNSFNYVNEDVYINKLVDSSKQINGILLNPLGYISVLWNTFLYQSEFHLTSFAGKYLSWLDTINNSIVIPLYLFLLFCSPFILHDKVKTNITKKFRCGIVVLFLFIILIMLTGIYVQWNSYGDNVIRYVQGRYFIPIILLMLLPFYREKNPIYFKHTKEIYTLLLLIVNIVSIINLVNIYI